MTSVIDVANAALLEASNRIQISSFSENTPAAQAANRMFYPKVRATLRAANWAFARKQVLGTQLKATIINNAVSDDPPPQPFQFEYSRPSDALKIRFVAPYTTPATAGTPLTTAPQTSVNQLPFPTGIPFVDGVDTNSLGQPIQVVMTDLQNAQIIYTSDLSAYPDMWDSLFTNAVTAILASFFLQALSGDLARMNFQMQVARGALDQARAIDGNERIAKMERVPDWLMARTAYGGGASPWGANPNGTSYACTWDMIQFPTGQWY